MNPPNRIQILSDGNELVFRETKISNKTPMLYYEYVLSVSKKGVLLPITQDELDKIIKKGIAVEI